MRAARRHIVFAVVLAVLALAPSATAGGGTYVFSGGSAAAQQQVRAALDASAFDWSLVPAEITIRIGACGCAGARPGLIVLDESLLADAPWGRAYTWALVQHEYAHEVWDLALDDAARARIADEVGGADLCYEQRGVAHDAHACERFADTLAWAYWPVSVNPLRADAVLGGPRFRALLRDVLGPRAWADLPRVRRRPPAALLNTIP